MAMIETRRSANGAISYRVRVRLQGQPEATGTFRRLTDAKRWVQDTESAICEGRFFASAESKRHTFADLVERYLREVLPRKPKNGSNTRQQLLWWKTRLGHYTLADVSAPLIVQVREELLSSMTHRGTPMSPSTVVRYLAALSHAYTIAVTEWGWVDDSPLRKVKKPKEPKGRERFLSDAERPAASGRMRGVVKQVPANGRRSCAVDGHAARGGHGLRWPQVDLKRGRILLLDTKNGASRVTPLTGLVLAMMTDASKVRRIDTDLVFYGPRSPGRRTLRRLGRRGEAEIALSSSRRVRVSCPA